ARGYDPAVDSVMYHDPDLPIPERYPVFAPELLPLWLKALNRPEADMRRLAAATIAQARRRDMPGLEPAVAPLLPTLIRPAQPAAGRLAAARALVALDAREPAEPLFRLSQAGDPDLRNLVEPALARWDYAPARAVWLERLGQGGVARESQMLALRGLA